MIQPLHDKVLIERMDVPGSSVIIVPEIAQERSMLGKVLAVGPGKWIEGINGGRVRRPVDVKPGQYVYFNSKWDDLSGTHYSEDKIRDKNLHLVMEADILLKVTDANHSS